MRSKYSPTAKASTPPPAHGAGARRVAALLLVPLLALAACGNGEEDEAERGPAAPAVVIVEQAQPGIEVRRDVVLPGRVEAVTQAQVSFLVDGRLEAILVGEGERVIAGQEIARIDDTDYQVELRQARTTEDTASADLARRRLLNQEGILARAMVEEAEANVAQARAQREAAERQVFYTRLTAPYGGIIGRRLVEVGTVVAAGEPVVTMVDGAAIDVAVDVPAAEAVNLPFGPELLGEGEVVGVGPDIVIDLAYVEHATVPDEQSRTYRLVMRGLPPPQVNLLPGMAIRVTLPDPQPRELPEGELLVPFSSVFSEPDGTSALFLVNEDEQVVRAPVELLSTHDGRALVRGEIGQGALVVVAGAQRLTDGQTVRPMVRD